MNNKDRGRQKAHRRRRNARAEAARPTLPTLDLLQAFVNDALVRTEEKHHRAYQTFRLLQLRLGEREAYELRDCWTHYELGHYERAQFTRHVAELRGRLIARKDAA
jgi:hypothetical protein